MSVELNKAKARRVAEEGFDNTSLASELFAPELIIHTPGGDIPGPEGWVALCNAYKSAFPDFHMVVEDVFGEGDLVALVAVSSGTFENEFMGIAPTGKTFELRTASVSRHREDGKHVEITQYFDTASFYQQLGINPSSQ